MTHLRSLDLAAERAREAGLTRRLHEGLIELPGLRALGPPPREARGPVVSVVHERVEVHEIAHMLDRGHGIAVRAGLHCAPWVHETVGTLETGAVRFGLGVTNDEDDVERALDAMRAILS